MNDCVYRWLPCFLGHAPDAITNYTCWLAWLTGGLVVAGAVQGGFLLSTLKLSRREFVASHRPRFVVREVYFRKMNGPDMTIGFVVANAGDGAGRIVASRRELQVNVGALVPLEDTTENEIGSHRIASGRHCYFESLTRIDHAQFLNIVNDQHYDRPIPSNTGIWFRGFIVYADDNGVERRTAFCRWYEVKTARFRPIDSPDFEYAD